MVGIKYSGSLRSITGNSQVLCPSSFTPPHEYPHLSEWYGFRAGSCSGGCTVNAGVGAFESPFYDTSNKIRSKKHMFSLFQYEALQYYIISFDLPRKILIKVNIEFN